MRKSQSGQALVLVLLSLSVVLTLVLYILSRSVTDISISSKQEEAVRAFSAAEAGIERSLVVGTGFSSTDIGNATYTTSITDFALGGSEISYPSPLSSGDVVTTWFTSHDANGNLTCGASPCFHGDQMKVCWGNPGTSSSISTTPAIEVTIYYETPAGVASSIRVARIALDPNSGRQTSNSFVSSDNGTCTIGNQSYQFQKTITFASLGIPANSYQNANGLQFAKIRMLYNTDTPHVAGIDVNFAGGTTLPSQGQRIDATGIAGGSNRRIVVYQSWAESPFAGNALISPIGITK